MLISFFNYFNFHNNNHVIENSKVLSINNEISLDKTFISLALVAFLVIAYSIVSKCID